MYIYIYTHTHTHIHTHICICPWSQRIRHDQMTRHSTFIYIYIYIYSFDWTLLSNKKGFPYGSAGKEFTCNVGDLGSIPGSGRSPGEGNGYPLQYPGLENSMDCTVHGVTKSQTWLRNFHFLSAIKKKEPQMWDHRDESEMQALSE